MPATLIAVPQDIEAEALLAGFRQRGHADESRRIGKLESRLIPALGIAVAVAGHGKAQFALQCQHLIEHAPGAERLICAGAAGRLDGDLEYGDIVIGNPTVEHDFKIRFVKRPLPRYRPDEALLRQFSETAESRPFSFGVHFGPVASGDEDIVDSGRARELRDATEAFCVAWEGSGGARAAGFNGLPFLEIRCITDGADADAPSTFHERLEPAMLNAADLLIGWQTLNHEP